MPFKTEVAAVHISARSRATTRRAPRHCRRCLLSCGARRCCVVFSLRPTLGGASWVSGSGASIALVYLLLLLVVPVGIVFCRTFRARLRPVLGRDHRAQAEHAFQRHARGRVLRGDRQHGLRPRRRDAASPAHRFPGRGCSTRSSTCRSRSRPVVVGLALILVYGRFEPIGRFLDDHGIKIIFSLPGMVLATIFVSLPLLVRELVPVLEEIGIEQEQAAWTLGRLRSRRSGASRCRRSGGPSRTASCSRSPGRSASSAPSRSCPAALVGKTQTLTLYVQQSSRTSIRSGRTPRRSCSPSSRSCALIVINVLRPKERS